MKTSAENKDLCHSCDQCCRYVNAEIDKPKTKSDFDQIRWFLWHENVNVYIDFENDWYLEFMTPCEALDKNKKLCKIYSRRPKICQEYLQKDCTRHNTEPVEKFYFKSPADLEKYLKIKSQRAKPRHKKLV